MTQDSTSALKALDLDEATATLLVADDPNDRHFIPLVLLGAAGIFLFELYAESFLEGLGFQDAAKEHGRRARALLSRAKKSLFGERDLDDASRETDATVRRIRDLNDADGKGANAGEAAVAAALRDAGAPKRHSEMVAKKVSTVIRG